MQDNKIKKNQSKSKEKFLPIIPAKGLNEAYIQRRYNSAKFRNLVDKEKIKQVTNKVDEYMKKIESIEDKERLIKLEDIEGKKVPKKPKLTEEEIQKSVISRLYSVKVDEKAKEKIKQLNITKAKKKKKSKNKDNKIIDEAVENLQLDDENIKVKEEKIEEEKEKKQYNTIKQNLVNSTLGKNSDQFIKPNEKRKYNKKINPDHNLTKVVVPRVWTAISKPKTGKLFYYT